MIRITQQAVLDAAERSIFAPEGLELFVPHIMPGVLLGPAEVAVELEDQSWVALPEREIQDRAEPLELVVVKPMVPVLVAGVYGVECHAVGWNTDHRIAVIWENVEPKGMRAWRF